MDTRRDSGPAVGAEEKWFASGGTYRSTVVENRECGWSCISSNCVTIILQSSVGTLEGHSEVGVYLASFCVPN
jgi:hypothetical protein